VSSSKQKAADLTLPQEKLNAIYRGVVEKNHSDPLKMGRCKIRVFGVHTDIKEEGATEGIPTDHLPWAEPATPIFGGVSKVGIYGVPEQGAHVFLFFENGHILQPRYFATAPGKPSLTPNTKYGFNDPDGVFPKPEELDSSDWNSGEGTSELQDIFAIEDKAGNKIEFDSTPGKEKITIQHGGTKRSTIVFTPSGGIVRTSGDNSDKTYTGAQDVTVAGNADTIILGDYALTTEGFSENVQGSKKSLTAGTSDEITLGLMNKKSAGLSWDVEGVTKIMSSGDATFASGEICNIKSINNDVKIEALAKNIVMTALMNIDMTSIMSTTINATLNATVKGMIKSSLGGGIMTDVSGVITTISGSAMVQITGGIIMIG
jgi:hypothetical protein